MWTKYQAYLEKIKNNKECGIVRIECEFDWEKAGIEEPARLVCKTYIIMLQMDFQLRCITF